MTELIATEESAKKAFLVGIKETKTSSVPFGSLEHEFSSLVNTLGLEILSQKLVHVREKTARYGMGSGKAAELAEEATSLGADCIIFDRDFSPSQQRNWEELAGIPVIDRQELIIQIFASRAQTKEAELQVNLAELEYILPRLQHKYIDLSRQRGGSYGNRGSGETRLETDRRQVEQKITKLKNELLEVEKQRKVQRKLRERQGVPVCALVGYTNSGKSTILNMLTGANVLAEDKLFATLDSTSRRLELPKGTQVLLIDTVGFIRRLPHSLINAFRSTIEETNLADILINVLDASNPEAEEQYQTTLAVLREIGAENIPMITVLNKIDLCQEQRPLVRPELKDQSHGGSSLCVEISATEGRGLKELCEQIESLLLGAYTRFRFPPERTDLAALLHRSGIVIAEKYEEGFIEVDARVDESIIGKLKEYTINE